MTRVGFSGSSTTAPRIAAQQRPRDSEPSFPTSCLSTGLFTRAGLTRSRSTSQCFSASSLRRTTFHLLPLFPKNPRLPVPLRGHRSAVRVGRFTREDLADLLHKLNRSLAPAPEDHPPISAYLNRQRSSRSPFNRWSSAPGQEEDALDWAEVGSALHAFAPSLSQRTAASQHGGRVPDGGRVPAEARSRGMAVLLHPAHPS